MRKSKYYVLELDNYGQPSGVISEKMLTKEEARNTPYCFKKYASALMRAID